MNNSGFKKNLLSGIAGLVLVMGLSVFFQACPRRSEIAHNEKNKTSAARPVLALSILPQTWFAQRLAGERVRTLVLVGPGQNPHSYEPTPAQMKDLAQADAWVLSGTEFEISLMPKIQKLFPGLVIIDGTDGVVFRMLDADEAHNDDEYSDGEYGIDRHTWLGLAPAKILASHIRDALVLIDPEGKNFFEDNYTAMSGEIDEEFSILRTELAPLAGSSVYVYHPGFGYLLDEFEIYQKAVESGGKEPGPRELAGLVSNMKQERASAIFIQAQYPVNAARTLAQAAGAQLISLDPLSADWLGNIRIMGNALKSAAQASGGTSSEQ